MLVSFLMGTSKCAARAGTADGGAGNGQRFESVDGGAAGRLSRRAPE